MMYPFFIPIETDGSMIVVPKFVEHFTIVAGSIAAAGMILLVIGMILYFVFDIDADRLYRASTFLALSGVILLIIALVLILATGNKVTP